MATASSTCTGRQQMPQEPGTPSCPSSGRTVSTQMGRLLSRGPSTRAVLLIFNVCQPMRLDQLLRYPSYAELLTARNGGFG